MKIVFFGDSNTWGYDPDTGARQKERFTRQISARHPEWEIIEEGLNGRTLSDDDPYSQPRNGSRQISAVIRTHMPYDVLVIMLGTNDAKRIFSTNTAMFARGLNHFLDEAVNPALYRRSPYTPGTILLVQPPQLDESIHCSPFSNFGQAGIDILKNSRPVFEKAADVYGTQLLLTDGTDGTQTVQAGSTDGIHLEKEGHDILASLLCQKLEEIEAGLALSKDPDPAD